MALVKAKTFAGGRPITYDDPIAAKIQQRRYQILVHSLLYYDLDITLVSDDKWAEWAKELVSLQSAHPETASRVIFAEAFKGFDASTGYNLPYRDQQVVSIAHRLLLRERTAESQDAVRKLRFQVQQTPAEYDRYRKVAHTTTTASPITKKEVYEDGKKPRKGLFSLSRK